MAWRLLARHDRWRAIAAYAFVPIASAAAWFVSFYVIYGTFSPAAPYGGYANSKPEYLAARPSGVVLRPAVRVPCDVARVRRGTRRAGGGDVRARRESQGRAANATASPRDGTPGGLRVLPDGGRVVPDVVGRRERAGAFPGAGAHAAGCRSRLGLAVGFEAGRPWGTGRARDAFGRTVRRVHLGRRRHGGVHDAGALRSALRVDDARCGPVVWLAELVPRGPRRGGVRRGCLAGGSRRRMGGPAVAGVLACQRRGMGAVGNGDGGDARPVGQLDGDRRGSVAGRQFPPGGAAPDLAACPCPADWRTGTAPRPRRARGCGPARVAVAATPAGGAWPRAEEPDRVRGAAARRSVSYRPVAGASGRGTGDGGRRSRRTDHHEDRSAMSRSTPTAGGRSASTCRWT